jgi:hypothetical protein
MRSERASAGVGVAETGDLYRERPARGTVTIKGIILTGPQ